MAAVPHHQAQARRFFVLARADCHAGDFSRAANALARSASHAATAASRHTNPFHTRGATRRRLTNWLFCLAREGKLPHGVVKTFRHIYDLPALLAEAPDFAAARHLIRRARTRVSALIRAVERAVAGCPQPAVIRRRDNFRHAPPPRPLPTSMSEILALPDFAEIAAEHKLTGVPLRKLYDPHGAYERGFSPKPCWCHPEPLDVSVERGDVPLSPLWQKALSKTFKRNFPDQLPY